MTETKVCEKCGCEEHRASCPDVVVKCPWCEQDVRSPHHIMACPWRGKIRTR